MSKLILEFTKKVAPVPADIRRWVDGIRTDNAHADTKVIQDIIHSRMTWWYSGQGAAFAAPSLIPGLGTAATIGLNIAGLSADMSCMLRNCSYMQLSMAHLHGKEIEQNGQIHNDRWAEFLVVMGLFTGIIKPASEVTKAVAVKIAINLCDEYITTQLVKDLNMRVGAYIFTKYGTKRGLIALGRAIPFAVGIGIGATINYLTMSSFGGACATYYNTKGLKNVQDAEFVVCD